MSTHTPGPWRFREEDVEVYDGHYSEPTVVSDSDDSGPKQIAIIRIGLKGTNANGALIAAAPELLEALKLYVQHFGDPLKVAKAAIAKAEGK